jgi:antitoxin PrlF
MNACRQLVATVFTGGGLEGWNHNTTLSLCLFHCNATLIATMRSGTFGEIAFAALLPRAGQRSSGVKYEYENNPQGQQSSLGSDFDDFLREEGLYDEAHAVGVLRSAPQHTMRATLTSKGQVTIPKRIRDALSLQQGAVVEFSVNVIGEVVLRQRRPARHGDVCGDRFDAVRGRADVHWRTDELMKLLRAEE